MTTAATNGQIITFYSYKGGTGRSMAVANIAWILAANNKRVLVIDWDLEAPGLQRYFRPFLVDKELASSEGLVDMITEFILKAITPLKEGETADKNWYLPLADIKPYVISLDWKFPAGGKIDFIPAGRQGPDYAIRFTSINWQKFYDVLGGGAFLEEVKKQMRPLYDYILIDSRTGVSDTSGICTVQMPDTLVVCFTFNNQSIIGASSVTQDIYEQRTQVLTELPTEQSPDDRPYQSSFTFRIVPAPMRVDYGERDKLELRQRFARWKFDGFIKRISPADLNAFWRAVEVPYQTWFSYEEVLSPFRDDPADPKGCLSAFVRLTAHITDNDVMEYADLIAPERKQEILQEFANTPVPVPEETQSVPTERPIEKQLRLAETVFRGLTQEQGFEAQQLWTRLVRIPRPGEGVETSKVRVPLSSLEPAALSIVTKFGAAGLIAYGQDARTGEITIEVSNEELLRSWPRLLDWIENDRWLYLWRQGLQTSKAKWEDHDRKPIELMHGRELSEAKRWYRTHRAYLNTDESSFIAASIRRQRLTIAIPLIALLFIGAASYTIYHFASRLNTRNLADSIATIAQQKIDASAKGNDPDDQFQLGLLLATEAARQSTSAKAEAILKENLPRLPRRVSTWPLPNNVLRVALSTNASQLLAVTGRPRGNQSAQEDRAAQFQDLQTGGIIFRIPFKQGSGIFDLSLDGRYLAIADGEGGVSVVDVATGNRIAGTQHTGPVRDLAFSPDGRYFASAGTDKTAQIVDLAPEAKGAPPVPLKYDAPINAVTFSRDSRSVAVADDASQVHIWQIKPGTKSWPPPKPIQLDSAAFTIALSPSGDTLATISFHNLEVGVWRASGNSSIPPLTHDYRVSSVTFTPDGKFVVTAGSGGNITVWDLNGKQANTSLHLEGDVDKLIFSADGKRLAAIGNSKVARVWDYNNGLFNQSAVMLQSGTVNDLAFGPKNLAITAGSDNTIRIWELEVPVTGDLQQSEPCMRLTRNLTIEEWNLYLASDLGAYRRTCTNLF